MNDKKIKTGQVSVILPLFGDFDARKVEMCIESIKQQNSVDMEIVVVEQTEKPKLSNINGITYDYLPIKKSADGFYMPGKVRNHAMKLSSGEFVYNNDGDILFLRPDYLTGLSKVLETNEKLCLYQPPMRRLPIENVPEFEKRFEDKGFNHAISSLDLSQPYGATYPDNHIRIRHFRKVLPSGKEEISVATEKDHRAYIGGQNQGKEPFFYTLHFHAGGIFMRRNQFFAVGGYCEDYAGWGCHDEDIQWKLGSVFDLQRISPNPEFEVLHLDHPRQYFSETRWVKNKELQKMRKEAGAASAIARDLARMEGCQ